MIFSGLLAELALSAVGIVLMAVGSCGMSVQ